MCIIRKRIAAFRTCSINNISSLLPDEGMINFDFPGECLQAVKETDMRRINHYLLRCLMAASVSGVMFAVTLF